MTPVSGASYSLEGSDQQVEHGSQLYQAKNYSEAFACFQKAVLHNHPHAQYRLGCCYNFGR